MQLHYIEKRRCSHLPRRCATAASTKWAISSALFKGGIRDKNTHLHSLFLALEFFSHFCMHKGTIATSYLVLLLLLASQPSWSIFHFKSAYNRHNGCGHLIPLCIVMVLPYTYFITVFWHFCLPQNKPSVLSRLAICWKERPKAYL